MDRIGLAVITVGLAGLGVASFWPRRRSNRLPRAFPPPSPMSSPSELWNALAISGVWHALEAPPSKSGEVVFLEPKRGEAWIFPVFSSYQLTEEFLVKITPTYKKRVTGDVDEIAVAFPVIQSTPEFLAAN